MPPRSIIALERIDLARTVAGIDEIREANPQRHEMEQLSRIVHLDVEEGVVAGVLEIPEDPWWGRGHVPGRPLMPGVLMVEAAAQLCSFFVRHVYPIEAYGERFFGFGGIDAVKFRGVVFPGTTLLLMGRQAELRPRRAVFDTQAYLDDRMVYEGRIVGMWI